MTDSNNSQNPEDEWEFSEGDVIEEEHEPQGPGGVPIGKSKYRIHRRLTDADTGKRFYYYENVEGRKNLQSAKGVEMRNIESEENWDDLAQ